MTMICIEENFPLRFEDDTAYIELPEDFPKPHYRKCTPIISKEYGFKVVFIVCDENEKNSIFENNKIILPVPPKTLKFIMFDSFEHACKIEKTGIELYCFGISKNMLQEAINNCIQNNACNLFPAIGAQAIEKLFTEPKEQNTAKIINGIEKTEIILDQNQWNDTKISIEIDCTSKRIILQKTSNEQGYYTIKDNKIIVPELNNCLTMPKLIPINADLIEKNKETLILAPNDDVKFNCTGKIQLWNTKTMNKPAIVQYSNKKLIIKIRLNNHNNLLNTKYYSLFDKNTIQLLSTNSPIGITPEKQDNYMIIEFRMNPKEAEYIGLEENKNYTPKINIESRKEKYTRTNRMKITLQFK